jgi:uncharacterized protein YqfB (UPF0267 family)
MNDTTHLKRACNHWKKGGGIKIFKHKRHKILANAKVPALSEITQKQTTEQRQQQETHPLEGVCVCVYFIN